MIFKTKNILAFCALCLFFYGLKAQRVDSLETKYYYYKTNPNKHYAIDSGIQNIEYYNFVERPGWEHFNLGNVGLAAYPVFLETNKKMGFDAGFHAFDTYQFSKEKIKYYNVKKPLSEIWYFIGSAQENLFGASHAQNIKNRFNYGVDFHRLSSAGFYNEQNARMAGFSFYSDIASKNNKYHFMPEVVYNKSRVKENGGIIDNFLVNDNLSKGQPNFYDTNLQDAVTEQRDLELTVTNRYDFGFFTTDTINDSLYVKKLNKRFSLEHTLGFKRQKNSFFDPTNADSAVHNFFYRTTNDTLSYNTNYHSIYNEVGFQSFGYSRKNKEVNFLFYAGARIDAITVNQNNEQTKTAVISVNGKMQSNPLASNKLVYLGEAKYFLTGYNQNDLFLNGQLGYSFGKFGQFTASAMYKLQAPTWLQNNLVNQGQTLWRNNFNKQSTLVVNVGYNVPKLNLALNATYTSLSNFIYFNENFKPQQASNTVQNVRVSVQHHLKLKWFNFNNFIGGQIANSKDGFELSFPNFVYKGKLYAEGNIFKGKMLAKIGTELRFNTAFDVRGYQPVVQQFYVQNKVTAGFVPRWDMFLGFKVQAFRAFFKAQYINEGWGKETYYNAVSFYPTRGRSFIGGIIWRFFE